MKCLALANRLCRDLSEKTLTDITSDVRQALLDAINGGLQRLDALAPHESKQVPISIPIAEPILVSLDVVRGNTEVAGINFSSDQCYRTIKIDLDSIDNAIVGTNCLFHPYTGPTGTITATIYCDAVAIPEPYSELVGDPFIIETGDTLDHFNPKIRRFKQVGTPSCYWLEANARNQNPPAPMVLRFDTLPDRAYRLEAQAILASARVTFSDLLTAGIDVPLRDEHIENYLLPIARGLLTSSSLWRDKDTRAAAVNDMEKAESRYSALVPRTFSTPRNRVGTPRGW